MPPDPFGLGGMVRSRETNAAHSPQLRGMSRSEVSRAAPVLSEIVGDWRSESLQVFLQVRGLAHMHLADGGRRVARTASAQARQAGDVRVAAGSRNLTQGTNGCRFDGGECGCIGALGLLIFLDQAFTFGDLLECLLQ